MSVYSRKDMIDDVTLPHERGRVEVALVRPALGSWRLVVTNPLATDHKPVRLFLGKSIADVSAQVRKWRATVTP